VRAALLLMLAACWETPPAPAAHPIANAMPRTRETKLPHHTEWLGRYLCAQGATGMHLTVDATEHATAIARFEFFPLDENPGVPPGSYKLTGIVSADATGALSIDLTPEAWINQPTGYLMVGIVGSTDPARQTLKGKMDHPTCTTFEATRSD
jgi:hypothetical protein